MGSIQRVAQFADERSGAIKIRLEQNELKLSSSSTDSGESEDTIETPYNYDPLVVGFNSSTSSTSKGHRQPGRGPPGVKDGPNPPASMPQKTPSEDAIPPTSSAHAHLTPSRGRTAASRKTGAIQSRLSRSVGQHSCRHRSRSPSGLFVFFHAILSSCTQRRLRIYSS